MAVLSDQTFKLSRNLKIATSIALMFSLFADHFCGSISIFGNDVPTALARFALAAVIIYHVVYLSWHAVADNRAFKATGQTLEHTVRDAAEIAEVNLRKDDIPADTPDLESVMEDLDSPSQRRQARMLFDNRKSIPGARKADKTAWKVALIGHVLVPIAFTVLAFALLVSPEWGSKIGALIADPSSVVCDSSSSS